MALPDFARDHVARDGGPLNAALAILDRAGPEFLEERTRRVRGASADEGGRQL